MAITQTITPLPPAPDPSMSEEDFDAAATEFTAALPPLVTEINALADQIEAEAANAASSATSAAASKNAAATSATNAANSATAAAASATTATTKATAAATSEANALASKNSAATSATNSANSATAAATSATYAKNRIDHVITQAGLTVNTSDATQLQEAIVRAGKLLGGNEFGASGCIFIGGVVVSGSTYLQSGDFSKISKHASFAGAGYLHLKLHSGSIYSMPRIAISGYEFGSNNYIDEIAAAYLFGPNGVNRQKNTTGANAPHFYYSSTQSAFMLRIKITSAEYLVIRLDAMDSYNQNPLSNLVVNSGMLTPLTVETI